MVNKVEIKSIDIGVGGSILTFEGPLLSPGDTIIDFIGTPVATHKKAIIDSIGIVPLSLMDKAFNEMKVKE